MMRLSQPGSGLLLVAITCLGAGACSLHRPDTVQTRMIEPQVLGQSSPRTNATNARPLRLLDTQARGHIGRRLLRQQPDGELTEDAVWRWSSAPDRYLDEALHLELEASPDFRLVDSGSAPVLAATLVVWHLETATDTQLVGAVEFQFTGTDRTVHTYLVQVSEPVSAALPGGLAAAAGRLLRRLASDGLTRVARES